MAARNLVLVMTALTFLGTSAAGCARDPKSPEAERMQAQRDAARERATTQTPDAPPAVPPSLSPQPQPNQVAGIGDNAAPLPDAPGPAEVGKDEDELAKIGPSQAQLEAEARANAAAAAKDKAKWEKQAHDADRRNTEEWSRDRVAKASARATELQNKSSRVPPGKRGKFNTDMTMFQTRKAQVLSKINSLSATGTDEWKITKADLDRTIDEMDQALIRLEGDF